MAESTLAANLELYTFEGVSCYYGDAVTPVCSCQSHRQVEIIVPFERSTVFIEWLKGDNDHQTSLGFGQVCIVPPQQLHQLSFSESCKIMLLQISAEVIMNATQGALRPTHWTFTGEHAVSDSTVVMLAKALKEWLTKEDEIAALYRRTLIRLLCVHVIAKYAQPESLSEQADEPSLYNPKLVPAISHIDNNLDKDLKVKVLARIAGLSPSHFSRMFKRSVGLTPHQYILAKRIRLAKLLLKNPQLSLSEISFRCGFYDQSHFILQFRRFTGTTPKAYREENEEKGAYF
ncbi:MAG: helix-turn-helix domain-containing protein [Phormidesmis sp.]